MRADFDYTAISPGVSIVEPLPTEGLRFDVGKARFDLLPPEAMEELAMHYAKGAKKYADRNWEKGYKWSLSYRALRSHLNLWLRGESRDQETGTNHLICVVWHAICLFTFELRGLGTDDIRRNRS